MRHLNNDRGALSKARVGIARRLDELRTPGAPSLTEDGAAVARR
jgi:hypothetical protein